MTAPQRLFSSPDLSAKLLPFTSICQQQPTPIHSGNSPFTLSSHQPHQLLLLYPQWVSRKVRSLTGRTRRHHPSSVSPRPTLIALRRVDSINAITQLQRHLFAMEMAGWAAEGVVIAYVALCDSGWPEATGIPADGWLFCVTCTP